MPTEKSDFWDYLKKWKNIFPEKNSLSWRDTWLDNPLCADCRLCCGPQGSDKPFPMGLLQEQMLPGYQEHFYLLNPSTAYLAEKGCRSDSSSGCVLARKERPVSCGLFPFVLANGKLYLYICCPAVLFNPLSWFYETGIKVASFLLTFSLEDLRHISLDLSCETLSSKYIDMHIDIFNDKGKCLHSL